MMCLTPWIQDSILWILKLGAGEVCTLGVLLALIVFEHPWDKSYLLGIPDRFDKKAFVKYLKNVRIIKAKIAFAQR